MKSLCVFMGSRMGANPIYKEQANALACEMVKRNITFVYGGARVGLMGQMADTILSQGGKVIGVIPSVLIEKEVAHQGITKLYTVDSMHERKNLMAELSDGFITLPGGFGTLDEICEMITQSFLNLHNKKCGFLNVDGYFDHFFKFIDHSIKEKFIEQETWDKVILSPNINYLLDEFMR